MVADDEGHQLGPESAERWGRGGSARRNPPGPDHALRAQRDRAWQTEETRVMSVSSARAAELVRVGTGWVA